MTEFPSRHDSSDTPARGPEDAAVPEPAGSEPRTGPMAAVPSEGTAPVFGGSPESAGTAWSAPTGGSGADQTSRPGFSASPWSSYNPTGSAVDPYAPGPSTGAYSAGSPQSGASPSGYAGTANPAAPSTGAYSMRVPPPAQTGGYGSSSYGPSSYGEPTGSYGLARGWSQNAGDPTGAQQPHPTSAFGQFLGYGGSHESATGSGSPWATHGTGRAGEPAPVQTLERPKRRTSFLVAGAVVIALAAGVGGGVLGSEINRPTAAATDSSLTQSSTSQPVASTAGSSPTPTAQTGSVQAVAAKMLPSVVSILSVSSQEEGEGSGIILSNNGLILTNDHVVADGTTLTVRFNDGSTAQASVVGTDATDDLAVIKAKNVSGLTVASLGSSANLAVGQPVVAIGSPLGLSATVTSGIVSALNRPVRTADSSQQQQPQNPFGQQQQQQQSTTSSGGTVLNAIQTDAAINPGNSGGPLVNMSGQVIGINSAIASLSSDSSSSQSGSIGVGFAIPIDQAHRIAQEIINNGHASHAVLGASVADATPSTAAASGSGTGSESDLPGLGIGATIKALTSGGGAQKAGLQVGDVVTKVGNIEVDSADALIAAVRSEAPGGTVTITYVRDSKTATAQVTLGSASS